MDDPTRQGSLQVYMTLGPDALGRVSTASLGLASDFDEKRFADAYERLPQDAELKFAAWAKSFSGGGENFSATPALKDDLLHPETIDPLSMMVSDFWLGYAEAADLDLVVCPTDIVWLPQIYDKVGEQWQWMQLIRALWPPIVDVQDGWLVSPLVGEGYGLGQIDRAALGQFLRDRVKSGADRLDDISTLANKLGGYQDWCGILTLSHTIWPEVAPAALVDYPMAQLYGRLSSEQRATLSQGGRVPIAALSPSAQQSALICTANLLQFTEPSWASFRSGYLQLSSKIGEAFLTRELREEGVRYSYTDNRMLNFLLGIVQESGMPDAIKNVSLRPAQESRYTLEMVFTMGTSTLTIATYEDDPGKEWTGLDVVIKDRTAKRQQQN